MKFSTKMERLSIEKKPLDTLDGLMASEHTFKTGAKLASTPIIANSTQNATGVQPPPPPIIANSTQNATGVQQKTKNIAAQRIDENLNEGYNADKSGLSDRDNLAVHQWALPQPANKQTLDIEKGGYPDRFTDEESAGGKI